MIYKCLALLDCKMFKNNQKKSSQKSEKIWWIKKNVVTLHSQNAKSSCNKWPIRLSVRT